MGDIYKIKVYEHSALNISAATYLQDSFITLNYELPASYGTIVDSNDSLTALGQDYLSASLFNVCIPFIYNSDFPNVYTDLFKSLSHFPYYLACAIDIKNTVSTSGRYLLLTTDNSDYYIGCKYAYDGRGNKSALFIDGNCYLYRKSNNERVSNSIYTKIGCASIGAYDSQYARYMYTDALLPKTKGVAFTFYGVSEVVSHNARVVSAQPSYTQEQIGYAWGQLLTNDTPYVPETDPYAGAGDSTTGGGDGTFDGSSDPVPVPSLPSIGATDTGFISLFVPSASQIRQVATYLWGPLLDISTFKKLFEDPMDCILGLSVVPVAVPTSGNAQITVGNVELSGITLPLASQQYVELDCGTITFDRYFGSYLDYEPYTKMSLFVPYSGVHSVSADDIVGKTVGLKYHIDILTGSLVAFLTCGDSVLYEFNGACASNIPVNSMNYASTIENAIRIAVNIGTTVATAGAAAPATGAVEAGKAATGGAGIGRGIAIAGSTAEGALSLKPSIDRAGSLGGTTGLMGNQIPYFIITRPRMCKPKNQDFFQGYPSFIQTVLGDMEGTGFTAFENAILAETYLTETEKAELSSILSAGVYL